MGFQFPPNLAEGFHISLQDAGPTWVVECSGVLDSPDASVTIQPHLLALHKAVVTAKIHSVRLDVQDLSYINSNGIKSFMAWFLAANHARDHRYGIEVTYDPDRRWQPVSFEAMERLAPKVVQLRPGPGRS